ncbi:MAG: LruC domain-containing protein [Bacteroidetes bacterium]|nr:LruC domain-containing protein [Bacteroidota bacterium]
MKDIGFFIKSIILVALFFAAGMSANAVVTCEVSKSNGGGFTTIIESVVQNCNGTYTIVLRVEHNGCGGPSCKALSHYSVEAVPGTYSNVSVQVRQGTMTYTNIDLGPNLGASTPFQGFKIDGVKNIGGGKAGVFAITYTLTSLQNQQVSAKSGTSLQLASFTAAEFHQVMNCNGTICNTNPSGLMGNVFHDINGLTDNTVNGAGVGAAGSTQLYVNLLNSGGMVLQTKPVNNNGTWEFTVGAGSYQVQLSTVSGTPGNTAPLTLLPAGWVNTGEHVGTSAGNDGTIDGMINTIVQPNTITQHVNFGIQRLPIASTNTEAAQENPGGTISVSVAAALFQATDPDGDVVSIKITAFPTGITTITINGSTYDSGSFPAQGITIPSSSVGNPTQAISVDPLDGVVTVAIPFVAIDNANFPSTNTGYVYLPFTMPQALGGLSGNVYHDPDGMSDNFVNGNGIGSPSGTPLYANLLDQADLVVASVAVSSGGTYSFNNLQNGSYTVLISTVQGTVGQPAPPVQLPNGWVNTGENVGTTPGSDGTPDGRLVASVVNNQITMDVNFAIEQLPTTGNSTADIQENPGGEIFVPVTNNLFIFDDPDGVVGSIRIISFPTNATSIKIGSATYTSTSFPSGGVIINVNSGGVLANSVQVDPINGPVTVIIPFRSKDNAGFESSSTGTVSLPFTGEYIPVDNFFPATGYGTLAFEDLWPGKGDYDFNDLVLDYRFELVSNTGNYVDLIIGKFKIRAFGASFENGFGFQLSSNINADDLFVEGTSLTENYISLNANGTEAGQSKPTIIVYDNAYNEMPYPGTGIGVNTDPSASYVEPVELEIRIYLPANTYTAAQVDIGNFNPFIIVNNVRSHEVHLPYYPPTDLADMSLFGQWEDDSNPATGRWYVTDKNHPWAINIYESFDYPIEKQDILGVHLKFAEWAMSGGVQFPDWYKNLPGYRNSSLIYQVPSGK